MQPLEFADSEKLETSVTPGDEVQIVTTAGDEISLTVTEIDDAGITGAQSFVTYTEVQSLSVRKYDKRRTAALLIGVSVVYAGIVGAAASTVVPPVF